MFDDYECSVEAHNQEIRIQCLDVPVTVCDLNLTVIAKQNPPLQHQVVPDAFSLRAHAGSVLSVNLRLRKRICILRIRPLSPSPYLLIALVEAVGLCGHAVGFWHVIYNAVKVIRPILPLQLLKQLLIMLKARHPIFLEPDRKQLPDWLRVQQTEVNLPLRLSFSLPALKSVKEISLLLHIQTAAVRAAHMAQIDEALNSLLLGFYRFYEHIS